MISDGTDESDDDSTEDKLLEGATRESTKAVIIPIGNQHGSDQKERKASGQEGFAQSLDLSSVLGQIHSSDNGKCNI